MSIDLRAPFDRDTAILLADYPRDEWESHGNFAKSTKGWLNAHAGFRAIGEYLQVNAEHWLDNNMSNDDFANEFGYYGNVLFQNLHGHHTWEDRNFFPEIFATEPKAERAIDLLEQDHETLDVVLDEIRKRGNRAIQLAVLDDTQMRDEVAPLRDAVEDLNALLARHLTDEEESIVPILLHYKMRG